MPDFRIDRRRFLAGLMAAGATLKLSRSIEAATPAEIDEAWTDLLKDPWIFTVSGRTITDEAVEDPELWGDVFDSLHTGFVALSDVEECSPLLSHIQSQAEDEVDECRQILVRRVSEAVSWPDDEKKRRRLADLQDLSVQLESEDDRWKAWVELKGQLELEGLVQKWLNSPLDWSQSEWFPTEWGGQGVAFTYFSSMDREIREELGIEIIEGDRPGSTYFAAELHRSIAEANRAAARLGLPFRFE